MSAHFKSAVTVGTEMTIWGWSVVKTAHLVVWACFYSNLGGCLLRRYHLKYYWHFHFHLSAHRDFEFFSCVSNLPSKLKNPVLGFGLKRYAPCSPRMTAKKTRISTWIVVIYYLIEKQKEKSGFLLSSSTHALFFVPV